MAPKFVQSGPHPMIRARIGGSSQNLVLKYRSLEWASFVNSGYIVRITVEDSWWNNLRQLTGGGGGGGLGGDGGFNFLKTGRREPVELKFQILKTDEPKLETEERTAILTEIEADGYGVGGETTFVGIDPPSFFLNSGDAGGQSYEGKLSDVIKRVVSDYAPKVNLQISEINNDPKSRFWMMRQDPKTFIQTILDWSCSLTNSKTSWIVASNDFDLSIKTQADLIPDSEDIRVYTVNAPENRAQDVKDVQLLASNEIAPVQTAMVTSGISALTGEVFEFEVVNDDTTPEKANPKNLDDTVAFSRPESRLSKDKTPGATWIRAVPEFSGGELGVPYSQWIDGRARNLFMQMLNMVMRIKVTVDGEDILDNSLKLGVSTVTLDWYDGNGKKYWLSGKWLIYGFYHRVSPAGWYTDLYLARLDHDAKAKLVPVR